jgi:hypothetical protein
VLATRCICWLGCFALLHRHPKDGHRCLLGNVLQEARQAARGPYYMDLYLPRQPAGLLLQAMRSIRLTYHHQRHRVYHQRGHAWRRHRAQTERARKRHDGGFLRYRINPIIVQEPNRAMMEREGVDLSHPVLRLNRRLIVCVSRYQVYIHTVQKIEYRITNVPI